MPLAANISVGSLRAQLDGGLVPKSMSDIESNEYDLEWFTREYYCLNTRYPLFKPDRGAPPPNRGDMNLSRFGRQTCRFRPNGHCPARGEVPGIGILTVLYYGAKFANNEQIATAPDIQTSYVMTSVTVPYYAAAGGAAGTRSLNYRAPNRTFKYVAQFEPTTPIFAGQGSIPGDVLPNTITFNTSTNRVLLVAHGLAGGAEIRFYTDDTLPAPLEAGRTYFVIGPWDADSFSVTTRVPIYINGEANWEGSGDPIDLTSAGSGTHTLRTYPFPPPVDGDEILLPYVIDRGNGITQTFAPVYVVNQFTTRTVGRFWEVIESDEARIIGKMTGITNEP